MYQEVLQGKDMMMISTINVITPLAALHQFQVVRRIVQVDIELIELFDILCRNRRIIFLILATNSELGRPRICLLRLSVVRPSV